MNSLPATVQSHRFRAMGCQMAIWLEHDNAETATEILRQAEAFIHQTEEQFTRFRPTSELSRLNAQPETWVAVSDELWHVIRTAIIFAEETGGKFDPTLLTAIEAAGYSCSFEKIRVSHSEETSCQNPHSGRWQDVQLDLERQAIWLPADVGIDLGGIGKGWTAEIVTSFLKEFGPSLIDAGGDLTAGHAPRGWVGWPVGISVPDNDSQDATSHDDISHDDPSHVSSGRDDEGSTLARLWLSEGSLATSGIDYRRWKQNCQDAHHLLNPESGRPIETDLITVSILDQHACRAEAWATATMVLGKEDGYEALQARGMAAACIDYGEEGGFELTLTPQIRNRLYF